VIVRILMDLNLLHKELGTVIIAAATVTDLIGWVLFALILSTLDADANQNFWQTIGAVLAFSAFVVFIGSRVAPFLIQWPRRYLAWPSGLIATIAVVVLLAAAAAESIGVHAVFGAFLIGIAFGQGIEKENQAHETIYQFAISFFAPLYFVSVGLQTNFVANFDWGIVLVVLIIACIGKIGGAGLGSRLGGMAPREALAVGFGMNARGAMEMVLASLALESGLIDQRIYVALVVMAMVTSLLSGPAMQYLLRGSRSRQVLAEQQILPES
jgi:Kef-type K+ transport system membrane component KefB